MGIINGIANLGKGIYNIGKNAVNSVKDGLSNIGDGQFQPLKPLTDFGKNAWQEVKGMGNEIVDTVKDVGHGIGDTIKDGLNGIGDGQFNPLKPLKSLWGAVYDNPEAEQEANQQETKTSESGIIENIDQTDQNQKELWEREDAIRKEIQEREDSAYQRAVADMRKAGINPNLINVSPASSGGGITNASKKDLTLEEIANEQNLQYTLQQIELNFKGEKAQKERIMNYVTSLFKTATQVATTTLLMG